MNIGSLVGGLGGAALGTYLGGGSMGLGTAAGAALGGGLGNALGGGNALQGAAAGGGMTAPMLIAMMKGQQAPQTQASFSMPGQFSMPPQQAQYGAPTGSYQNALAQALAQYKG